MLFPPCYQGVCRGDPESKAHELRLVWGMAMVAGTVPAAEILPNHFNKKGALIDAKRLMPGIRERLRRYAVLFCARESLGRQGACGKRLVSMRSAATGCTINSGMS